MLSRLALISIVLITSLPLPLQAHDPYTTLKDRHGRNCCNSLDCQPAPYQVTPRGVRMLSMGAGSMCRPKQSSTLCSQVMVTRVADTGAGKATNRAERTSTCRI